MPSLQEAQLLWTQWDLFDDSTPALCEAFALCVQEKASLLAAHSPWHNSAHDLKVKLSPRVCSYSGCLVLEKSLDCLHM